MITMLQNVEHTDEGIIRCRISASDYPLECSLTQAMWECWIVGKLKEAGVPIIGILVFRGIKSGTLRRFNDPVDFGATIYEWIPNAL